MAARIFRSLFRRSRNRPQTIPQLLKIPKQKRPSFRKNGRTVLLCLYFELEGRLFWFLFGTLGNTRVKIKRKERGLKLILMTGRPARPKSAKNRARAHWKRGDLPRMGPALRMWRGIIAIMSRCTPARRQLVACGLRLAAAACRTCAARKIAILPIPCQHVRTLKNG